MFAIFQHFKDSLKTWLKDIQIIELQRVETLNITSIGGECLVGNFLY